MTLFKKYYKEANNDIKADEAFINSVIEKAQKKRVPSQKSYYRYALTAAAAVVVLSATAVTMPLLTDNDSDGVISVVTQTAQPQKDEVLNTPTHSPINTAVPDPPEKVKGTTKKISDKNETTSEKKDIKIADKKEEKKNDEPLSGSADKSEEKKPEIFKDTAENGMETSDRLVFSDVLPSGAVSQETITTDTADSGAYEDTAENRKNQQQPAYKAEPDKMINNSPVAGVSGGGGGGSVIMPSESHTVLPPSRYYILETGGNRHVFAADNGATITVTTQYTNGADTEPVYNGLNVSFTNNGTKYNIFSDTAEKTSIDELVNSLR